MMPKTETSVDDTAEEWSTPWEEDPTIEEKRKRRWRRNISQVLALRTVSLDKLTLSRTVCCVPFNLFSLF